MTTTNATTITTLSEHACFGGVQGFYQHDSSSIGLPMRFSVYMPPAAKACAKLPALIYLAGLTCTEETFPTKGGAQQLASELGIILISPDTSPRGAGVEGEDTDWDFGTGAGFYLNASNAPWSTHYQMERYVVDELRALVQTHFHVDGERLGIFGHSMGGHGALTLALRYPGMFKSVSAFAPICAPTQCPWGQKAFAGYLGADATTWNEHDASALMAALSTAPYRSILIDQGLDDKFLLAHQLLPEHFEAACNQANQPLTLRRHQGYDHGYYFIQTFMNEHLRFHHTQLMAS